MGGDFHPDRNKTKSMLAGIINTDIKIPRSYYEKTFKEKLQKKNDLIERMANLMK